MEHDQFLKISSSTNQPTNQPLYSTDLLRVLYRWIRCHPKTWRTSSSCMRERRRTHMTSFGVSGERTKYHMCIMLKPALNRQFSGQRISGSETFFFFLPTGWSLRYISLEIDSGYTEFGPTPALSVADLRRTLFASPPEKQGEITPMPMVYDTIAGITSHRCWDRWCNSYSTAQAGGWHEYAQDDCRARYLFGGSIFLLEVASSTKRPNDWNWR